MTHWSRYSIISRLELLHLIHLGCGVFCLSGLFQKHEQGLSARFAVCTSEMLFDCYELPVILFRFSGLIQLCSSRDAMLLKQAAKLEAPVLLVYTVLSGTASMTLYKPLVA